MLTSSMSRLSYTRVPVEVNLMSDLPYSIEVTLPNGSMIHQLLQASSILLALLLENKILFSNGWALKWTALLLIAQRSICLLFVFPLPLWLKMSLYLKKKLVSLTLEAEKLFSVERPILSISLTPASDLAGPRADKGKYVVVSGALGYSTSHSTGMPPRRGTQKRTDGVPSWAQQEGGFTPNAYASLSGYVLFLVGLIVAATRSSEYSMSLHLLLGNEMGGYALIGCLLLSVMFASFFSFGCWRCP
ncbi:hypothetical protein POTOM_047397 [Populus tomentosa]|uniref:Uncharacterized protein n=1 Tax=Populus tomentosa TaxID=118781 RepID=A0A8X7YBY0_POPTO|nr:hypothetical protein POTOM_047397 [Populus tomentosa]